MRARVLAAALVLCVAVTGYVLWTLRDRGSAGRASGHATAPPLAEPTMPAPPAPTPTEPIAEAAPAPAVPQAPPSLLPIDPPGPGTLVGVVRSTRGDPVFDADVKITPLDKSPATTTRPDAQGFVRVDGLGPGRYMLDASHPGFAPRSFLFEVQEGKGAGPFDIVLVEGGALRVRVVGPYGTPLVDQAVRISQEYGVGVRGGATDARGEILFEHLPAGQYWVRRSGEEGPSKGTVTVRRDGTVAARKSASEETRTATVEPGKTVEVVFEISCTLLGTLFGPDGRPLAGAILRLTPAEFGPEGYRTVEATTNDDGGFELRGFAAGAHRPNVQVLPRHEEGQPPVPGYVVSLPVLEFVAGQVRTEVLRVPASTLAGRITRASNGEALGGDRVQITASEVEVAEGKVVAQKGGHNMAWADDNGRFRFVGLPPGHYQIWVFALRDNLSPIMRVVDYTAGGTLENIDFALSARKLGRVRLRVLEPDGTPATGLSFGDLVGEDTWISLHERQVGDGVYEVSVEVGPRRISVYRKGFVSEEVAVEVPPEGVVEREVRLRAQ